MTKEIKQREDINLLVNTFYIKIRKDNLLGPIFNAHIKEEQWPKHLDKLTDFWETALLGKMNFKGKPTAMHKKVDASLSHTISKDHFEHWISLWHTTVDSLFVGALANRAKQASINMGSAQFNAILHFRNQ